MEDGSDSNDDKGSDSDSDSSCILKPASGPSSCKRKEAAAPKKAAGTRSNGKSFVQVIELFVCMKLF